MLAASSAAGFLSLDVDGRVIRLDTLAKLLGPGYRLGWLAGPPALAAKFSLYTAGTSIGANMLSQVGMVVVCCLPSWFASGMPPDGSVGMQRCLQLAISQDEQCGSS